MKKLFLFLMLSILLLASASALFETKTRIAYEPSQDVIFQGGWRSIYSDLWEKYPPIKVEGFLGLSTKSEIALQEHTEYCGDTCYSVIDICNYEDSPLVEDIRFIGKVRKYDLSYKIGEEDYEDSITSYNCTFITSGNGTKTSQCTPITNKVQKKRDIYTKFNVGDKLKGCYKVKIEGEKNPNKAVDWIITSNGKEIEELALWNGTERNLTSWTGTAVTINYAQEDPMAQTFNISSSFRISKIQFYGYRDGNPGTATIKITGTNASGAPNLSDVINTTTANADTYPTSASWIEIPISTPKLNKNTQYALVMSASVYGIGNDVAWHLNTANPYASGMLYDGTNAQTMQANKDTRFIIFGTSTNSITINSPSNYSNSANVIFNATIDVIEGINITNASLFINNILNQSQSLTGVTNYSIFQQNFSEGTYNWSIRACDTDGDCGMSENRTLTIDLTAPQVSILYPTATIPIAERGQNISLNYSITGNPQACWFAYNGTNNTINCNANSSIILDTPKQLIFYANDSAGNLNTTIWNWDYNVFITSLSYTTPVTATSLQQYNTIFSYNGFGATAILRYNNTDYTATINGTGTENITTSVSLYVPTTNTVTSKQLYWVYAIQSASTEYFNSTNYTQIINPISSMIVNSSCNPYYYKFTFADEQTLTSLSNFNVNYNFNYGITDGNSRNIAGNLTNISQFTLCLNSTLSNNWTIGYGEIQYYNDTYSNRRYYIFEDTVISNQTPTNITLYDLLTSQQTSFALTIQDTSLRPYSNNYAQLLKWYPNLNEYKIVEMIKTDAFGSSVIHTKAEDTEYRIGVYDLNGNLIKLDNPTRMVCLVNPCTFLVTIDNNLNVYNDYFDLNAYLEYNETNSIFRFTYSDTSGRTQMMTLNVTKETGAATTSVCSSSSSGAVGVIVCNISQYTSGTFKATAYRTASPQNPIAQKIIQKLTTTMQTNFGLWLTIWIAIPIIFITAMISPIAGIVGGVIALLPAYFLQSINISIIIGIAVLGGIIYHFIKRT